MKLSSLCTAAVVLAPCTLGGSVSAQCPQWTHGFEGTDLAGHGLSVVAHDDGSGPSLYVGGGFTSAGDVLATNVARWDGANWHAVGAGTDGLVYALAVFDEGAGPRLFAAGTFTQAGGAPASGIARWDGTSWTAVGGGLGGSSWNAQFGVWCLQVFDDGTGPALYAGGSFSSAGGTSTKGIARWDGATWSPVGGGVSFAPSDTVGYVTALAVHDDGSGPQLVVAGGFDRAGIVVADNLARWDGSSWSAFGTGLASTSLRTLAVLDEGSGPRLFAGGSITHINGAPAAVIARWDGSSWSSLPGLYTAGGGAAYAMFAHDDGTGPALWVAGNIILGPPSFATFARWNGATWTPITDAPSTMSAAAVFDEGQGPRLFIVGASPGLIGSVARWDGASWSVLRPSDDGRRDVVNAAAVIDEPGGPALYIGCGLPSGLATPHTIARWDGSNWTNIDGLPRPVLVLETIGAGTAARLHAGVSVVTGPGVWRLENGSWIPIGGSLAGTGDIYVSALAEFDDGSGPALFVGGRFTSIGGVPAARIAKWNGSSWSTLGSGVSDTVHALKVWDDGGGPALYAAGFFQHAGSQLVNRVAKWDGTSWSALGSGVNTPGSRVFALEVWNDGSGSALYAGGTFSMTGGVVTNGIARWSGAAWSNLGIGLTSQYPVSTRVRALHGHDDGSGAGSALYVGGTFEFAGGVPVRGAARWNGQAWSALGPGTVPTSYTSVNAFATHADGSGAGPALFAGGQFTTLGDTPALNISRWTGCGSVGQILCAGDGSGSACPCGNASAPGEDRGCTHALGQGARLRANGVASRAHDSLVLRGDDMTPSSTCLYFQGLQAANGGAGAAFGDGLRCASGTAVRLAIRTNVFGASSFPLAGEPPLGSFGGAPGSARVYQIWYRDAATFCTPDTFNFTNGLRVVWTD